MEPDERLQELAALALAGSQACSGNSLKEVKSASKSFENEFAPATVICHGCQLCRVQTPCNSPQTCFSVTITGSLHCTVSLSR